MLGPSFNVMCSIRALPRLNPEFQEGGGDV